MLGRVRKPNNVQILRTRPKLKKTSVSDLLRNAIIEKIEDEIDLQTFDDVLAKREQTYSLDEVKKQLGLSSIMYTVRFSDTASKKLRKMDRHQEALLVGWIEKNLMNCADPRSQGKALVANHKGQWRYRYRVGDYRILALIEDEEIVITVIDVGHRNDVYA